MIASAGGTSQRRCSHSPLAGALAGNRVASRVDASRLTAAFTALLIAVAAYSLTRSLPGLV